MSDKADDVVSEETEETSVSDIPVEQSWKWPGFEDAVDVVKPKKKKRLPLAEELAAMREQAQQEGFSKGHTEGVKQGFEAGRQEGLRSAEETYEQEMAPKLMRFEDIVNSILAPRDELKKVLMNELVDIVTMASQHIAFGQCKQNPEHMYYLISELFNALSIQKATAVLTVSEDDAEIVKGVLERLGIDESRVVCKTDSAIMSGGCRFATEVTEVDATIEVRLEKVLQAYSKLKTEELEQLAETCKVESMPEEAAVEPIAKRDQAVPEEGNGDE